MKNTKIVILLAVVMFVASCGEKKKETKSKKHMDIKAPVAEKIDSVLKEHGRERVDPYFWMRLSDDQKNAETPDAHTQKVYDYLNKENEYTQKVMAHTEGLQKKLYDEIVGRIKQTDESVPYFFNEYWYYTRFEEGKEYPIYCRKKGSLEAEEQVMLDVNKMAEGFGYYAAGGLTVSEDNKILAFAEDTLSRRVYTIKFKNLETGKMLKDEIPNVSGGGTWAKDNKTFFYTAKNKISLLSEKIYRHELGQSVDKDVLVYHEKDPSFYIGVSKSKSREYIVISTSSTTTADHLILDANNPKGEFKSFIPREKGHEYGISHFKDKFYVISNRNAKNFKLLETSTKATSEKNWKEVIPHREDVLLEGVDVFNDYLVVSERKDGLTQLRIINQNTKDEHYLDFGEAAYTAGVSVNPDFNSKILRYGYSSMTTPGSTYDYEMDTKKKTLLKQQEVVGGHNPEEYQVERVWVTARDGVKVPMSIVYKKGFKRDGTMPLLQYAYGSYGHTIDPGFSTTRLSLLDRGFAFAISHIRGGQTMGRKWYDDGKMFNKKNTFTDFVDCSKYLIENKYTSANHLYALGGSAGGLLMGVIVNTDPELYNGVIAAVPFVDIISTMWDESIPLTTNEFDEWGNPKNLDSYEYMLSYSPYDNVKEQNYPNLLITTGLFDSQVQYWEPAKWIAKLRDKKANDNVLMMDCDMESGHGGASGRFKRYKNTALEYAFFLDLEGIKE